MPRMDLKTVDHLLTSTRSVRKRLDFSRPVEPEVLEKCIELAFQAPTGSNAQGWHVVVVTDDEKRKVIGDYYREAFKVYTSPDSGFTREYESSDLRHQQMDRVFSSAGYMAENFEKAPVFVMYCIEGRVEEMPTVGQASVYGSILPAAWSFMLAARSRGLGSAWTTLHLFYEKEIGELLGIPPEYTQAVLLPVAYFTGDDFKPAKRLPAGELTSWDSWGRRR